MRTKKRFGLMALFAGFVLLLGACSTESTPPDGLAFQDSSGGDSQGDQSLQDTTTVAPTTTAAPTTTESTVPKVNRPTNRTCQGNDHTVVFDESVVLIAPSPNMSGPYTVDIPAGTYDITVSSWLGLEDYVDHTDEQWYFSTNSGYTSPLSTDSSPELITNDLFSNQTVGATTSITLHHKSPSSAQPNSVHPLCIGFKTVSAPQTTSAPTTTTAAPTTTTTIQVAAPTTTTTAAPTTTTQATAVVPAQLALTGASELSMSLGLAGAALTLAGVATVMASRRSEDDE